MKEEWKKVKLGDYIDILSGYAFKTGDFIEKGVPVIKIKNVNPPIVTQEDVSFVSEEIANKCSKYILNYNDVLIATTGSHINQINSVVGRVARVKYKNKTLLNQRVGKLLITDSAHCNFDFIYHYLSQFETKVRLANIAGGAANQANISPSDIKNLEINLPPLPTQQKIAAVLGAYDDLIENNRKQIKLLEEAAQKLYKEWYVKLNFSGHENTNIVDGIPEGWKIGKLSDVAHIIMGQSPKSEFYNNKNEGLPFHQGVGSYGARFVIDSTYSTAYTKIAEKGSILFSVRAPVGRLNYTKNKIVIGRGLSAINHKDGYQSFLYYLLKAKFFKDDIVGNGAIFASINKEELHAQEILIPEDKITKQFNDIVAIYDSEINALDDQIQLLQSARDNLLPKLMSGEIDVSEIKLPTVEE